ncbi:MAG TPA: leucyl aminopeptidase [Candidatus Dormibacteraeota bacterium]|nr:leucyl aminopeptidase [Candidatus Dormibacteraeota bacterium]
MDRVIDEEGSRVPHVALATAGAAEVEADVLAVPVAAGAPPDPALAALGEAVAGFVTSGEHRGRLHDVLLIPAAEGMAVRRVLLYGVGQAADLDGQRLRFAHQEMVRAARGYGHRRIAVLRAGPLRAEDAIAVVEGCVAGGWDRRSRATGDRPAPLEEVTLAGFDGAEPAAVEVAGQLGAATARAREWQNTPGNEMGPERLAEVAAGIAGRHGLEFEVLGPDELAAGGYRLLLGVGAGSARPPRLIRLQHRGGAGRAENLALVGKGITFDSGGLSLKTADGMLRMRGDMGGAAAVLAAIEVVAASRLPVDVMAVVAASDNMPGGAAQRPGDVWTSASGRTVEILSTDAEGRLVLADAITHAVRAGATHVVDLATLTGAAVTALGHAASVAVSNDDELWRLLAAAAETAGERVWRLPAYPEFRELIKSQNADLRNSHYGEAGAIAAGMFIGEFVEGRPWVHLDIAGSHWNENVWLRDVPRGPLGTGARLCYRVAERLAAAPG